MKQITKGKIIVGTIATTIAAIISVVTINSKAGGTTTIGEYENNECFTYIGSGYDIVKDEYFNGKNVKNRAQIFRLNDEGEKKGIGNTQISVDDTEDFNYINASDSSTGEYFSSFFRQTGLGLNYNCSELMKKLLGDGVGDFVNGCSKAFLGEEPTLDVSGSSSKWKEKTVNMASKREKISRTQVYSKVNWNLPKDKYADYFTDTFKRDLLTMDPDMLFETYGTHIITSVGLGGRYDVSCEMRAIDSDTLSAFDRDGNVRFTGISQIIDAIMEKQKKETAVPEISAPVTSAEATTAATTEEATTAAATTAAATTAAATTAAATTAAATTAAATTAAATTAAATTAAATTAAATTAETTAEVTTAAATTTVPTLSPSKLNDAAEVYTSSELYTEDIESDANALYKVRCIGGKANSIKVEGKESKIGSPEWQNEIEKWVNSIESNKSLADVYDVTPIWSLVSCLENEKVSINGNETIYTTDELNKRADEINRAFCRYMSQQTSSVLYPPTSKGYLEFTGKPVAVKEGTGFDKSQELDSEIQNLHAGYNITKLNVSNINKYNDTTFSIKDPNENILISVELTDKASNATLNNLPVGTTNATSHKLVETNQKSVEEYGSFGSGLFKKKMGKGAACTKILFKDGSELEDTIMNTDILDKIGEGRRTIVNVSEVLEEKKSKKTIKDIEEIKVTLYYTTEAKFGKKSQLQDWYVDFDFNFTIDDKK